MTPMIDIVFQLLTFFMVLINFEQSQQVEEVLLPTSAIIRPPKVVIDIPIFLHVTEGGNVYLNGIARPVDAMAFFMQEETSRIRSEGKDPTSAVVIIRADAKAKTGYVQDLMKLCQQQGFQTFKLRVKEPPR